MIFPNESTSESNSQDINISSESWSSTWCEKDFEKLPMLPGNHSLKMTFYLIRIYKKYVYKNSELLNTRSLLIHSKYFRPILEDLISYSLKIYKFHKDNETDHRDIVEKMYLAIMDFCENVVDIPTLNDKDKIKVNYNDTFNITKIIDSLGHQAKDVRKYNEYNKEYNKEYNEYSEYNEYKYKEYKEYKECKECKEYKECKECKEYKKYKYREYRECTRHNAIQHEDLLEIEQESFVHIHDCLLFHLLNLRLRVVEIVDQDGIMFDLEQQIIKRCEKSNLFL
ncbi:hypothetical protein C2G38_2150526 [Gigaspora rosea]|uniref:Uncharacterized protein n=1 Tax=Gigaspora rosea TaxID=44941 RepID=A0A397TT36_9GLOM|nr:hypothetical protein C2G38_2150526 [Gigaspora rosea]